MDYQGGIFITHIADAVPLELTRALLWTKSHSPKPLCYRDNCSLVVSTVLHSARLSGFDPFAPSPSYHKENGGERQKYHDVVKIRTQAAGEDNIQYEIPD